MYEKHSDFQEPKNSLVKIWRYMSIEKFQNMLETNSLHFAKVNSFEDPYEGIFSKISRINQIKRLGGFLGDVDSKNRKRMINHIINFDDKNDQIYRKILLINCWHLNEHESASMWKIHSNEKYGIAIQSTLKRLKNSFDINKNDKIHIGTVRYEDYSKYVMPTKNSLWKYLTKRKSFECESELRVMVLNTENTKPKHIPVKEKTKNGKYVEVDMDTLIEKIYISPLTPNKTKKKIESMIHRYGSQLTSKIIQSDLYTLN